MAASDVENYEKPQAVFSVEKVVNSVIGKNGHRYYKVKWADSWEPEENLNGCQLLIDQYWKEVREKEKNLKQNSHKSTNRNEHRKVRRKRKYLHLKDIDSSDSDDQSLGIYVKHKPPTRRHKRIKKLRKPNRIVDSESEVTLHLENDSKKRSSIKCEISSDSDSLFFKRTAKLKASHYIKKVLERETTHSDDDSKKNRVSDEDPDYSVDKDDKMSGAKENSWFPNHEHNINSQNKLKGSCFFLQNRKEKRVHPSLHKIPPKSIPSEQNRVHTSGDASSSSLTNNITAMNGLITEIKMEPEDVIEHANDLTSRTSELLGTRQYSKDCNVSQRAINVYNTLQNTVSAGSVPERVVITSNEAEEIVSAFNENESTVLGSSQKMVSSPNVPQSVVQADNTITSSNAQLSIIPASGVTQNFVPSNDVTQTTVTASDETQTSVPGSGVTQSIIPTSDVTQTFIPSSDVTQTTVTASDETRNFVPASDVMNTCNPAYNVSENTVYPCLESANTVFTSNVPESMFHWSSPTRNILPSYNAQQSTFRAPHPPPYITHTNYGSQGVSPTCNVTQSTVSASNITPNFSPSVPFTGYSSQSNAPTCHASPVRVPMHGVPPNIVPEYVLQPNGIPGGLPMMPVTGDPGATGMRVFWRIFKCFHDSTRALPITPHLVSQLHHKLHSIITRTLQGVYPTMSHNILQQKVNTFHFCFMRFVSSHVNSKDNSLPTLPADRCTPDFFDFYRFKELLAKIRTDRIATLRLVLYANSWIDTTLMSRCQQNNAPVSINVMHSPYNDAPNNRHQMPIQHLPPTGLFPRDNVNRPTVPGFPNRTTAPHFLTLINRPHPPVNTSHQVNPVLRSRQPFVVTNIRSLCGTMPLSSSARESISTNDNRRRSVERSNILKETNVQDVFRARTSVNPFVGGCSATPIVIDDRDGDCKQTSLPNKSLPQDERKKAVSPCSEQQDVVDINENAVVGIDNDKTDTSNDKVINSQSMKDYSFVPDDTVPRSVRDYIRRNTDAIKHFLSEKQDVIGNKLVIHRNGIFEVKLADGGTLKIRHKDIIKFKHEKKNELSKDSSPCSLKAANSQTIVIHVDSDVDESNQTSNENQAGPSYQKPEEFLESLGEENDQQPDSTTSPEDIIISTETNSEHEIVRSIEENIAKLKKIFCKNQPIGKNSTVRDLLNKCVTQEKLDELSKITSTMESKLKTSLPTHSKSADVHLHDDVTIPLTNDTMNSCVAMETGKQCSEDPIEPTPDLSSCLDDFLNELISDECEQMSPKS